MDALPVAIPWNLSCYVRANGFHPLYRALFEDNAQLSFNALDEVRFAHRLCESDGFYRELLAKREACVRALPPFLKETAHARRFVEYVSPSDLALARELPGALEFHHTAPLTVPGRPFVLHCESFLPVFQPFWSQGVGRLAGIAERRALYGRLLGDASCLGIFSHIPATLDQLSRFFRDPAIDAKLHPSRIGLSRAHLDVLLARPRAAPGAAPVFLFTNSAHQSPGSFELRGGMVALLMAERFLKAGRRGDFLFRAKRPPVDVLREAGLDAAFLASVEGHRLVWIEGFLPEHEQLRLFTLADFLLLPSVNLHSVTIMQALAAGAVPVVSDTHGPENYVTDGETGIVLRGMRDAAWREDPDTGIPVDHHELSPSLNGRLADQALERVGALLDAPGALDAFRGRMRETVQRRHLGAPFRDELSGQIARLWQAAPEQVRAASAAQAPSLIARENLLREGRWERFFESPPLPLLVANTGETRVLFGKGVYLMVRGDLALDLDELSPLALHEQRYPDPWKFAFAERIADFADAFFWSHGKTGFLAARWRYGRYLFQERAKVLLRPYKRLYRAARWAYRTAVGFRRRTGN